MFKDCGLDAAVDEPEHRREKAQQEDHEDQRDRSGGVEELIGAAARTFQIAAADILCGDDRAAACHGCEGIDEEDVDGIQYDGYRQRNQRGRGKHQRFLGCSSHNILPEYSD